MHNPFIDQNPFGDPMRDAGGNRVPAVVQASAEPEGVDVLTGTRAGDSDRDRIVRHLGQCHALGYLNEELFRARMVAASHAVTRTQLNNLVSDLDALPAPARQRVMSTGGRRRALHIIALTGALMWTIPGNVFIWSQVGRADDGTEALFWLSLVLSIITAIIAGITWGVWEDDESDKRNKIGRYRNIGPGA